MSDIHEGANGEGAEAALPVSASRLVVSQIVIADNAVVTVVQGKLSKAAREGLNIGSRRLGGAR